ncbi:hypothetical protein [Streptomyces sp. NPDC050738]|uniref:hypothetical protein n=1 Tax=Streptomyces sp. NPDC050738 TaxID=3154744 RepID=UPI00342BB2C4
MDNTKWHNRLTPRGMVLSILGVVTLAVAILSMAVSFQILNPRFGTWSVPTVGALDSLWVVFQATEILAGNNRRRSRRVWWAGLALTAVNAAIPTADLILHGGFDLAVILTPIAIIATKTAWWIALPSLGRPVSAGTRQRLDAKAQQVRDRFEEMEADAAHQIEMLGLATMLERQVAEAETEYRQSALKTQQTMTNKLHKQAEATAKTVTAKPLPEAIARIALPELGQWKPVAPTTLPVAALMAAVTQVSELDRDADAEASHRALTEASHRALLGTIEDIAAVTGVTVPVTGEQLADEQVGVVLRALRYSEDPPMSYRAAIKAYRNAGFVGSEHKIRAIWRELKAEAGQGGDEGEDEESEEAEDVEGPR